MKITTNSQIYNVKLELLLILICSRVYSVSQPIAKPIVACSYSFSTFVFNSFKRLSKTFLSL